MGDAVDEVLLTSEIVLGTLILLLAVFLVVTLIRRRLIAGSGVVTLCALRGRDTRWRSGLLKMTAEHLQWYPLFGITPRPVDTAAAAALRAPDPVEPVADVRAGSPERATSAEGWSEEPGPVTVGEARRQAEISAAMRAERDRWDTTMAAGVDQAQRRNATDRDGLDRERRDQPLHQDRSLAADLVRDRGYDATLTEGRGPSRESDRGRDRSDEAGMGIEP